MNQVFSAVELIKIAGIIVSIMGSLFAINRQIRAERTKLATKEYVDKEIQMVNTKIENVRDFQEENRAILEKIDKRIEFIYQQHYRSHG